jgi:hypothetical protein
MTSDIFIDFFVAKKKHCDILYIKPHIVQTKSISAKYLKRSQLYYLQTQKIKIFSIQNIPFSAADSDLSSLLGYPSSCFPLATVR